jgi:peptidoglycan endopeptidase LytE
VFDDQQLEDSSPKRGQARDRLAPADLVRRARRAAPALALVAMAIAAPLAAEEITVRRGDTLGEIAGDQGVPLARLAAFNSIADPNRIYEGQVLRIPPAAGETEHLVQPGETLGALARRYDVTIDAIVARNALTDPNRIIAGRSLIIPDPAAASAPTTTAAPAATEAPTTTVPVQIAPVAVVETAPPTTVAPAPPTTAAPAAPATTVAPAPPVTEAPAPPTTPATTPTPAPGVVVSTIWVVQPGDTVTSVAARVGLSAGRLAEANRIAVTTALTPGQYLFVPTR